MTVDRLRGIVLPLLIAMLTTLLTVGTLSLVMQTPIEGASRTKAAYLPW